MEGTVHTRIRTCVYAYVCVCVAWLHTRAQRGRRSSRGRGIDADIHYCAVSYTHLRAHETGAYH
eukprot:735308-Pyramimonas_sp.AAC.1